MKERSGTAGYIAPEIKGSKELVSPAIDMWGFGVILYEMCVAYKPTAITTFTLFILIRVTAFVRLTAS